MSGEPGDGMVSTASADRTHPAEAVSSGRVAGTALAGRRVRPEMGCRESWGHAGLCCSKGKAGVPSLPTTKRENPVPLSSDSRG